MRIPNVPPAVANPAHIPTALARSSSGKTLVIVDRAPGINNAAPTRVGLQCPGPGLAFRFASFCQASELHVALHPDEPSGTVAEGTSVVSQVCRSSPLPREKGAQRTPGPASHSSRPNVGYEPTP